MAEDYQPRTEPRVPIGHRTWCAVSRVKDRGASYRDLTPNEQVEWLLEAITRPGADMSQRHDDLYTLAELLMKCRGERVVHSRSARTGEPTAFTYVNGLDPNVGYGVKPIDSDTHDPDCIVCGDAKVYEALGHDVDFDRHPYTTTAVSDVSDIQKED